MVSRQNVPLTLDIEKSGAAAIVHISGSASISEADRIRTELEGLADKKVLKIVLDLEQMDFICSAGLGAIISAHLKGRHHNGQISLVSPQPSVRKLLETTRLTKLFPIFDDVQKAVVG